jgi:hypothetical protein
LTGGVQVYNGRTWIEIADNPSAPQPHPPRPIDYDK